MVYRWPPCRLQSAGMSYSGSFGNFQGYNRPELHGHRKRECANMSRVELHVCSQAVYQCLLSDYWEREKWIALRVEVEQLVNSVSKYADGLDEHLKRMKSVHASETPAKFLIAFRILSLILVEEYPQAFKGLTKSFWTLHRMCLYT